MNIFYLDENPGKAAEYHCDVHVVKMILETAQMLSAATNSEIVKYPKSVPKHPCTLWVGSSQLNYQWTVYLFMALNDEYTKRYNKTHSYNALTSRFARLYFQVSGGDFTSPAQAMPEEFRDEDPVVAYRRYYKYKADTLIRPMTWHKDRTNLPEWWDQVTKEVMENG